MDAVFYQKYAFIDYHLVAQLKEWKRVKPYFEAKLHNVSPSVKPIILQSLMQFKQRMDKARLRLYDVIKYVSIYSRCSQLWTLRWKLEDTPKTGLSDRYIAALDTIADIDVMRERFKGSQPIAFKKLPYELKRRLVELLPPADVALFKLASRTALTYGNRRKGMFCHSTIIITNSLHLKNNKMWYDWRPKFTFSSMRCFLNCETYFARNILCLNLNSTDQWDRAVQIVAGDFTWLGLRGPYTWKHAISLMNVSKNIRYVSLDREMLLEVEDFDDFFEAIVQWLRKQKYATAIYMECPTLDLSFEARIREYVESRTNFDVILPFNWVVICKEPKI